MINRIIRAKAVIERINAAIEKEVEQYHHMHQYEVRRITHCKYARRYAWCVMIVCRGNLL